MISRSQAELDHPCVTEEGQIVNIECYFFWSEQSLVDNLSLLWQTSFLLSVCKLCYSFDIFSTSQNVQFSKCLCLRKSFFSLTIFKFKNFKNLIGRISFIRFSILAMYVNMNVDNSVI